MKELSTHRQNIDAIDDQILDLIFKRFQITNEIGHMKAQNSLPVIDQGREDQIISRLAEKSRSLSLNPDLISSIYRSILSEVVAKHQELIKHSRNTNQD